MGVLKVGVGTVLVGKKMWVREGKGHAKRNSQLGVKGDSDGTHDIWCSRANGRTKSTSGVTFYVKPIRNVQITGDSWKPRFSTERFLTTFFS